MYINDTVGMGLGMNWVKVMVTAQSLRMGGQSQDSALIRYIEDATAILQATFCTKFFYVIKYIHRKM